MTSTVSLSTTPPPIDDLQGWLMGFTQPTVWLEFAALAGCVLLAWLLASGLRKALEVRDDAASVMFGRQVFDGAMFPLLLLVLGYIARSVLLKFVPLAVFKVAIPVLVSLVVIRLGVKVLQVAFTAAPWVRVIERTISWMAWGAMVLWVSGLLPVVLTELDEIHWKLGASTLSLRTLLEGALTAGAVMIVVLWISAAIESRLLKSAVGGQLSLRKAVANATRAVLLFFGLIFALSAVGIDLTALSVLGGAIGVGIGFGLQKLAANYVSGFVILAERSMRIGDNVRVDNFEGRITDIKTRYTVIRALNGRESIVPNEMMITQRIENSSLADPKVALNTVVQVAYGTDLDQLFPRILEVVGRVDRVIDDPAPGVLLSNFAADGLELTIGFWIADPDRGLLGVRSEVNRALLRLFDELGVEIPFPQRVLRRA